MTMPVNTDRTLSRRSGNTNLQASAIRAADTPVDGQYMPRIHVERAEATCARNRPLTIYFSPTSLSGSNIMLGSPRSSPEGSPDSPKSPSTLDIQETQNYRAEPMNVKYDASTSQQALPLQSEMDIVVRSLVSEAVVNTCDVPSSSSSGAETIDSSTVPSTISTSTCTTPAHAPPLTSGSSASSLASVSEPNLDSLAMNIKDINVKHTSTVSTASPSQDMWQPPKSPHLAVPSLFHSVALTDPKIVGKPVRFTTVGFKPGSNALKVGSCTFLNLPYGTDTECGLRIEPRPWRSALNDTRRGCDTKTQRIQLQIVQSVVQANTGRQAMLLCAETDVTEGFISEVRRELATATNHAVEPSRTSSQRLHDIQKIMTARLETLSRLNGKHSAESRYSLAKNPVLSDVYQGGSDKERLDKPTESRQSTQDGMSVENSDNDNTNEDIWFNMAQSLTCVTPSSTHLPSHPPKQALRSPALRDLVSLLNELRILHRHFFVIRMKSKLSSSRSGSSDRATPIRFSIPWLSAQLFQKLFAIHESLDYKQPSTSGNEGKYNVLGSFKDAMAYQLSSKIWPGSDGITDRECAALPFFKKVTLPSHVDRIRDSIMCDSRVRQQHRQESADIGVYATPMFDDAIGGTEGKGMAEVRCWMCFLVDKEMEGLW